MRTGRAIRRKLPLSKNHQDRLVRNSNLWPVRHRVHILSSSLPVPMVTTVQGLGRAEQFDSFRYFVFGHFREFDLRFDSARRLAAIV